ncbi:hypothetical protein QR685DRAFT_550777 [Neurospora intermedia]|uniref:HNH nuclease domain-containing protein n=1 Tax=Neurospora intermedia TaxID=5142 RepID=A0ABR3DJC5_NEUIN
MVILFGKEAEAEMFSPRNDLLLHKDVEKALDLGIIAIVPDLAEATQLSPTNYSL